MLPRDRPGLLTGVLCLLLFVRISQQHGSGAPSGACKDQTPRHATIQPQSSVPPYIIKTSASQVRQGDTLGVTITSPAGLPTTIGGFILQARVVQKRDTIVGEFLSLPDTRSKLVSCESQNDTVTHTSPDDKQSLTFTWQAPKDFLGGVEFRATVAQSYATFWKNVESPLVEVVSPDTPLPEPNTKSPHPIYQGCQDMKLCFGSPGGCIETGDCKAIVSVQATGNTYTWEVLGAGNPKYVAAALSMDNKMGDDSVVECVKDDNGKIELFTSWTYPKIDPYVNRTASPQQIAKLLQSAVIGDMLYCKFTREPKFTAGGKTFDMSKERYHLMIVSGEEIKDANRVGFHGLVYESTDNPVSLSSVGDARNIPSPPVIMETKPAISAQNLDPIYQGCSTNKLCFGTPANCVDNGDCKAVVAIFVAGDVYTFEIQGTGNPKYVAAGLSRDKSMGEDSAMECVRDDRGRVHLYTSWTYAKEEPYVNRKESPQQIAQLQQSSTADGKLYCKFIRDTVSTVKGQTFDLAKDMFNLAKDMLNLANDMFNLMVFSGLGWKESPQQIVQLQQSSTADGKLYCKFIRDTVSTVKGQTFDLAKDMFNLMVVSGDSMKDADRVGFHSLAYEATDSPLSLKSVGAAAGASKLLLKLHGGFMLTAWLAAAGLGIIVARYEATDSPLSLKSVGAAAGASKLLLKLHGGFMLTAWLAAAGLGIIVARYFKQTWVGSRMGGKDIWFAYHRLLMVLTWLLTMAGFVLILVEVGGWTGTGDNPHAYTGLATVILCFLQPIGAYFRPHPGTKRRPAFNWLHWFGGNAAHILGIITIFLSVSLPKAELPSWSIYVLAAYVVFHIFMHLVLTLTTCVSDGRIANGRVNSFPMKDLAGQRTTTQVDRSIDAPYSSFRKLVLSIYGPIIALFAAAMISLVALSPIAQTYSQIMGS